MKILKVRPQTRHTSDGIADELLFNRLLSMERKRSERTGAPFLLVLINFRAPVTSPGKAFRRTHWNFPRCIDPGHRCYRLASKSLHNWSDIHFAGRYKPCCDAERSLGKIQKLLGENLQASEVPNVEISFHFFPESDEPGGDCIESGKVLYAEHEDEDFSNKAFAATKRTIDIAGSLFALLMLSPLFVLIAVLIKMTSDGPIFYRQRRLGKSGAEFTFLKFRSMYVANDSRIHREFTQNLIRGNGGNPNGVYKIQRILESRALAAFLERAVWMNCLSSSMS
jgi:hypothetical protein